MASRLRRPDGATLEFPDEPELVARIDRWIALESECCGPIRFERKASGTPGRVRVEIRGADPDRLEDLFTADTDGGPQRPTGDSSAPCESRSALGDVLRAGLAGSGLALLVCCGAPLALGALFGTAVAAPFVAFDAPKPIAAVAIGSGIATWFARRHRSGPLRLNRAAGSPDDPPRCRCP